jgi:plasmid replication initiation protein
MPTARPLSGRSSAERTQLELFRSVPGDLAARDAQDLMAWPFFSLAKARRTAPIDFRMGATWISVEAVPEHGMATIWDADVLIWAASQLIEARDAGRPTSRLMVTTPHEILAFTRRGTGKASYERLKAALDRLQSTTVATSIRQEHQRRRHRFSWINEWRELADGNGRALGIELILPDWFYAGGLERWLYRIVRKHGGRQQGGWSFDVPHLYLKSGVLSPLRRFAFELRAIVARQPLPGYVLTLEHALGRDRLNFTPVAQDPFDAAMRRVGLKPVENWP